MEKKIFLFYHANNAAFNESVKHDCCKRYITSQKPEKAAKRSQKGILFSKPYQEFLVTKFFKKRIKKKKVPNSSSEEFLHATPLCTSVIWHVGLCGSSLYLLDEETFRQKATGLKVSKDNPSRKLDFKVPHLQ